MIKSGDRVFYKPEKDFRGVVLDYMLKTFAEKARVEIVKNKSKADRVAVADTIDINSNIIINSLIKGKISDLGKLKPVNRKIIKPLYLFLDEEILLYAKIKKLKFVKKKIKQSKIGIFIDELEKKHPEVKRAVINSYLELNN